MRFHCVAAAFSPVPKPETWSVLINRDVFLKKNLCEIASFMTYHHFVVFQLTFTEPQRAGPVGCCCLLLWIKNIFKCKIEFIPHSQGETQALNGSQKAARSKYSSRSHTRIGTILARRQWCSALWDPLTSTVLRVSLIPQGWAGTAGYRYLRTGLQPRDQAQALPLRAIRGGWDEDAYKKSSSWFCSEGTLGPFAPTSRWRRFFRRNQPRLSAWKMPQGCRASSWQC